MNKFQHYIIDRYGEQGAAWLASLPQLTAELAEKWQLTDLQPMPNLTWHYVMAGWQQPGDRPVIVKLSTGPEGALREATAISWLHGAQRESHIINWYGSGCVKLIDADIDRGAILMERLVPGTHLSSLFPHEDEQAVRVTAKLIKQLHARPLEVRMPFKPLTQELSALFYPDALRQQSPLLHKAQECARHLLATAAPPVVLHGDLHQENILYDNQHGWLAIDPKGILGDPSFEVGAFLRNPIPMLAQHPNVAHIMTRRLDLFAQLLGLDRERLRQWGFVQAVLAACWSEDDHDAVSSKSWLTVARILDEAMP